MDGRAHGTIDHWLEPVRDVSTVNFASLECIHDDDAKLDKLCELAVIAQVDRLSKTPIVRSAWASGKNLAIHGWVYGLTDGLLTDLKCTASRSSAAGAE